MKATYFLMVIFLMITVSCTKTTSDARSDTAEVKASEKKQESTQVEATIESDSESDDLHSTKHPSHPYPREPISAQYYSDFLSSNLLFSQIRFKYFMTADSENPNARRQFFKIQSRFHIDPATHLIISNLFSDMHFYDCYYIDLDTGLSYKSEVASSQLSNIFQIMQNQSDYYFNAAEYGGETSLNIAMEGAFGHKNYITFTIEEPELVPYTLSTVKTLCKGWDPGDNPPSELMPMINYLENVIIPMMRNHPYP